MAKEMLKELHRRKAKALESTNINSSAAEQYLWVQNSTLECWAHPHRLAFPLTLPWSIDRKKGYRPESSSKFYRSSFTMWLFRKMELRKYNSLMLSTHWIYLFLQTSVLILSLSGHQRRNRSHCAVVSFPSRLDCCPADQAWRLMWAFRQGLLRRTSLPKIISKSNFVFCSSRPYVQQPSNVYKVYSSDWISRRSGRRVVPMLSVQDRPKQVPSSLQDPLVRHVPLQDEQLITVPLSHSSMSTTRIKGKVRRSSKKFAPRIKLCRWVP